MGIVQNLFNQIFRRTPLPPPAITPRQQHPIAIPPSITRSTYDQIKSNLLARVYFSHHIHEITNETDALVCTVDSNGYLREKALRYLMEHYQPSYANRILLRLSDWVWPIRTLAESWFIMHMETFSLRDLDKEVDVLCFVFRKPSIKTTPVYAAFAEYLHRKMCAARKQHFYKLSIQFRKLIYEILQARNIDILAYLKTEPAPVLMAIPFAQKAANLPDDYLEAIIDSSTWAVKSKLYDYYIRNNSRPPERFLRDSLAASSYAVRSMAKHYLQLPEAELADLYLSLDHPKRLYVSDLRRECDREFLVDAFRSGASRDREILFEYFLEKDKSVFTQDTLMELYFGGTKLRGKLLKNLAHTIDASTLTRYRDRILDASGGEPWPFLELLARVSRWQYLFELARMLSTTSADDPDAPYKLERHYFKMRSSMPYYSRDTGEKNKTLALFQALPEGFLSERFYKQIRFDLK